jgi:exodeoxyribonuclease VII large subunit
MPFLPEIRNPKVYSVSELTGEIRGLLENEFDFVWVEGEITNFSAPLSGHYYMVLKDKEAQIRAVMFRPKARYLRFLPENGLRVIVQGRISVYQPRGEYQIVLDYLEPMGVGDLALAFEHLKKKLAAQGVFDREIKKPLPFLPQRVAVITSPTGAAIRDFLKIIRRRFANIDIVVVPVRVQGEEATRDIVEALDLVNRELDVDVIVLTRGGGSLEDLWAFNQEDVAFAIRRSRAPVVSAVGHEIDLTISDLAADFRAPTPSAAAELLVTEKESLLSKQHELKNRLVSTIRTSIRRQFEDVDRLARGIRDPRKRFADNWLHLDEIYGRLTRLMGSAVATQQRALNSEGRALVSNSPLKATRSLKHRLDFQEASLARAARVRLFENTAGLSLLEKRVRDLSPLATLNRGFSITRKLPGKKILRDASEIREGTAVQVILAKGGLECRVEKVEISKTPGN